MDLTRFPYRMKAVPVPDCQVGEDMVFSEDNRTWYLQNSLLNLPGLSDGSITVIDMARGEPIASVDTLKNQGLNPNCIVLLPQRP